jgi:hypothetical protein
MRVRQSMKQKTKVKPSLYYRLVKPFLCGPIKTRHAFFGVHECCIFSSLQGSQTPSFLYTLSSFFSLVDTAEFSCLILARKNQSMSAHRSYVSIRRSVLPLDKTALSTSTPTLWLLFPHPTQPRPRNFFRCKSKNGPLDLVC